MCFWKWDGVYVFCIWDSVCGFVYGIVYVFFCIWDSVCVFCIWDGACVFPRVMTRIHEYIHLDKCLCVYQTHAHVYGYTRIHGVYIGWCMYFFRIWDGVSILLYGIAYVFFRGSMHA